MEGDWEKLSTIFPAEVWVITLRQSREPSAFLSACNASTHLRDLVRRNAVEKLYPLVAKVLLLQRKNEYFKNGKCSKRIFELRKVCRSCKLWLDNVLQDKSYYYPFNSVKPERHQLFQYTTEENFCCFTSLEDFVYFEKNFNTTHWQSNCNPFVTRGISLEFPEMSHMFMPFYDACLLFLQKYGLHVWYCLLYIEFEKRSQQLQFYQCIGKILELLPNLKGFHFINNSTNRVTRQSLRKIEKFVTIFPTFAKLRFLEISGVSAPVLESLIKSNKQMRIVVATHEQSISHAKLFLEQLPNLRMLHTRVETAHEFRMFRKLQVASPLETLHLYMRHVYVPWEEILSMIERNFSDTLSQMWLNLPASNSVVISWELTLPNLRVLHLTMPNAVQLDFLMPLNLKLEELSIESDDADDTPTFNLAKQKEKLIRLYKFWKDPQHSNIWIKFSKLQLLRTRQNEAQKWYICGK